jgi:hypothetical protein
MLNRILSYITFCVTIVFSENYMRKSHKYNLHISVYGANTG